MLELPLVRPEVEEAAAYGAALLGGVAGGVFGPAQEAVDACVRTRNQVDPTPGWVEAYAPQRARFRALYPALRDMPAWDLPA